MMQNSSKFNKFLSAAYNSYAGSFFENNIFIMPLSLDLFFLRDAEFRRGKIVKIINCRDIKM